MTFTIRPAVREKIGLLFGIAGASGSGKTRSALELATGIANGSGRIVMIDTEAGRALHYAPPPGEKADPNKGTFDFLRVDFPPPFTPERYIEAIQYAEKEGGAVIIIDSMSHEWEGEGGCSDIQDAEAWRMAKGDPTQVERMTAPAWKAAKKPHNRMMSRLIQTRTHLIFCLRAREKIKIKAGRVEPIGFQPICEKNFMFELSGSMTLHPETPGEPRYDLPRKLNDTLQSIFPEQRKISIEAGRRLRAWADTGAEREPPDKAATGARDLIERIEDTDEASLTALLGDPTVTKQRDYLKKNRADVSERVERAIVDALERNKPQPLDEFLGDTQPARMET